MAHNGVQDSILQATTFLTQRLHDINMAKQACGQDELADLKNLSTMIDIEDTRMLFANAHFKPFNKNQRIPFCLYPNDYQPSGHINVSRAREFYLNYECGENKNNCEEGYGAEDTDREEDDREEDDREEGYGAKDNCEEGYGAKDTDHKEVDDMNIDEPEEGDCEEGASCSCGLDDIVKNFIPVYDPLSFVRIMDGMCVLRYSS
jgi:hypothetical protein